MPKNSCFNFKIIGQKQLAGQNMFLTRFFSIIYFYTYNIIKSPSILGLSYSTYSFEVKIKFITVYYKWVNYAFVIEMYF